MKSTQLSRLITVILMVLALILASIALAWSQSGPSALSEGPFEQLIIRGVTLINGNGAPPRGPVDLVIEGNRIAQVQAVGYPGVPIGNSGRPQLKSGIR